MKRSMVKWVALLAVMTLLLVGWLPAHPQQQAEAPDLKGTWETKCEGIAQDNDPQRGQTRPGILGKDGDGYLIGAPQSPITIYEQKGAFFKGKRGEPSPEPFVGLIEFDNKTIDIVDTNSSMRLILVSPDEMQGSFVQTTWLDSVVLRCQAKRVTNK